MGESKSARDGSSTLYISSNIWWLETSKEMIKWVDFDLLLLNPDTTAKKLCWDRYVRGKIKLACEDK